MEHASLILARIEATIGSSSYDREVIGEKLDKVYLELIDLYLIVDKPHEC